MSFFSNLSNIVLIIATILALPVGLFGASLMSQPRGRWISLFGGLVGAIVAAAAIYYYAHAAKLIIDVLGYGLGVFFACSVGVAVGALLANFLLGLGSRGPDVSSLEF